MGLETIGWIVAGLWAAWSLLLRIDLTRLRNLPPRSGTVSELPGVSVILTARDEEARVGATIERFLAQRDVNLDLVVIDDRSTDATGSILDDWARRDERVRAVHVDALPDGWLGKTWACRVGADHAGGDWLLFTDADAWTSPDLIARSVEAARAEQAEHVCLLPSDGLATVASRAGTIACMLSCLPVVAWTNRDVWKGPVGIGAFNLIRADAYRSIGGHESLRFDVVDDAKLGLLLLRGGYRTRVFGAPGDLEVHWAPTFAGIFRAFEKNLFAAFGYRTGLASIVALGTLLIWLATLAGPLGGTAGGIASLGGFACAWIPAVALARQARFGALAGWLAPFVLPVVSLALLHSMTQTIRRGGVRWRETFYPLDRLRRGVVR